MNFSKVQLLNPQSGETWEHSDGGSFYVLDRKAKERGEERQLIRVQRRPPGDSQAEPEWISLRKFAGLVTGRLT